MRVEYVQGDKLPPLAWIAYVKDGFARVIHGNKVECFERFFVEGAWSGSFERDDFCWSDWFCGTGARIEDEKIVFSTPTHVTYSLYSAKAGGGVHPL